ncbi:MAG TPA: site-2 protease family protein [Clostridia bacterium]|nr:site-2 protease family protein [Clostridia bacterium]
MSDPIPPIASHEVLPHEVYVIQPRRRHYQLHLFLLLTTFFTTLVVGARLQSNFLQNLPAFSTADDALPLFPLQWIVEEPGRLLLGLPFSLTLMGILLAHEMGHYLYCREYDVYATLPFFIPAPTLIGTLGAFIRIQSPIRSRAALFDIGIAGPIAGFVVAVPVMIVGLMLSKPLNGAPASEIEFGFPLVFWVAHAILAPVFPNTAVPLDHLYLHPVAVAAWVGMFATALNLLPGGQLDGGHLVYAVAPRAHKWVTRAAMLLLVPMAILNWVGWLIWAVLLGVSGMRHPNVPVWPDLNRSRRRLAVLALVLLLVTIVPAPFKHSAFLDLFR